jgi:hypothetical protein
VIHPQLTIRSVWSYSTVGIILLAGGWSVIAQQPAPNSPQPRQQASNPETLPVPQSELAKAAEMVQQSPNHPLQFTIDPKTPLKILLPAPPKAKLQKPSAFVESLADVPELMLSEPVAKGTSKDEAMKTIALQLAKVNHLNKEKSDRFMEALVAERDDLAGLPFEMGGNCRQSTIRRRYFKEAVAMVRNALGESAVSPPAMPSPERPDSDPAQSLKAAAAAAAFFARIHDSSLDEGGTAFLARLKCLDTDDATAAILMKEHREHATSARLAAMMQICSPTTDGMKLAMARYFASISSVEATHALVKTILFTPEEDARNLAIEALKTRQDEDYVDRLLQGFRYPWPQVAHRAADALVKLDRKDLVPKLIDVLDEPDPRAPITKKVDGKAVTAVREIVRINHHRNCLMCHAPGRDAQENTDILTAQTPAPGEPLPSMSGGSISGSYGSLSNPGIAELVVRIDVTYLRQDFSVMLPVADDAPWPQMQRFDFVVRTRTLKDDEAIAYKEKFDHLQPGALPPNHMAALAALRKLTGKDTAPTADAWRQLANR